MRKEADSLKKGAERVGYKMHDLTSEKELQQPKQPKRHIDRLKNIQFALNKYEWMTVRKLVSQSKIGKPPEQWKTTTDIAEEYIRLTLSRGKTIINMVRPSDEYQTKGNKINVWLTPEEWGKIEALAILHGTSIKRMAYSFFAFGIKKKREEIENEILSAWTHTERNKNSYGASDVLLQD